MIRACLCLAALAAAGLPAREEKAELSDDLARVPAKSKFVVSVRLAKMWESEWGKAVRAAAGDRLDYQLQMVTKQIGLPPGEVERFTFASRPVGRDGNGFFGITRALKKLDPKKVLPTVLPKGKEERIGGRAVFVEREAAYLIPEERTLIGSNREVMEKLLLKEKPGKPEGELAAMLRLATEHDVTLYVKPSPVGPLAFGGMVVPAIGKDLPKPIDAVAWVDLGYTSKFRVRQTFADEKTAARARKVIDGGRLVAAVTLSEAAEKMAGGSKPIRKVLEQVASALGEAQVEQKGTVVLAAFEVKVDKETADAAIKDWVTRTFKPAATIEATNNLKHLAIALHSYHDAHGKFPPAATCARDGKPLLSWRVAILPHIGEEKLYKEFKLDEAWDSPHNKKLIARMPNVFISPVGKPARPGGTFYQAIRGKGAAFEGNAGLTLRDFTDGLSNTILVVEAARDVPWTKPEDLAFDPAGDLPKFGRLHEGGFYALMGDGSVRFIKKPIRPATLKALITRSGGEPIGESD